MSPRLRGSTPAAPVPTPPPTHFENDPICLFAEGVLTPGQPLVLGAQDLQAAFLRQPIEITGFRFLLVMENAGSDLNTLEAFQPTPAAYVRLQAKAGRFQLTHSPTLNGVGTGFVPIGTLCPRINSAAEYGLFPGDYDPVASTGASSPASYCEWKFDRPLAMPLGTAPELQFQYVPPGPASLYPNINVYVSVVGRMLTDMPGKIYVPYASAWVPQSGLQDTSENDFKNISGQTVRFRKIVARAYQLLSDGEISPNTFWQEITRVNPNSAVGGTFNNLTDYSKLAGLQLFDDMGRGVLREPAYFSTLWPEDLLSLPFHYDLEHGKHISASYSGQNIPSNSTWMPVLTLLGTREERAY